MQMFRATELCIFCSSYGVRFYFANFAYLARWTLAKYDDEKIMVCSSLMMNGCIYQ